VEQTFKTVLGSHPGGRYDPDLSKERLKQLLRDLIAEIEAGETPTGERTI
jgi:hypothetical protein